jgi:xylulokinase
VQRRSAALVGKNGRTLAFIGIDAGTSSVKTIVVRADGERVDITQRPCQVLRPHPGWAEQDPEALWKVVRDSLQELQSRNVDVFRSIEGISFSGQMHGLVALDSQQRPLRNAILWCDQRAAAEVTEAYESIGRDRFRDLAANDLSSGFLLTSLMWLKRNEPEVYAQTRWVLPIKDFIRLRLSGTVGVDHSDASATLAYDSNLHDWSGPLLAATGLNLELFPPVRTSASHAGDATGGDSLGFLRGVPVFHGAGDSVAQQLGNGIVRPDGGWIANIGTASSLNCVVSSDVRDAQYRLSVFDHVEVDRRLLLGASLSGGSAITWTAHQVLGLKSSAELTLLASASPPGSNGVMFLPHLSGARLPRNDPGARASFVGLTSDTTPSDIARATVEGVVFQMAAAAEIFDELGLSADRLVASGGGSRSDFLVQLQADVLGRPTKVAVEHEQACLGAAIIAAVGGGVHSSFDVACHEMAHLRPGTWDPDPGTVSLYREWYGVFDTLDSATRGVSRQINNLVARASDISERV